MGFLGYPLHARTPSAPCPRQLGVSRLYSALTRSTRLLMTANNSDKKFSAIAAVLNYAGIESGHYHYGLFPDFSQVTVENLGLAQQGLVERLADELTGQLERATRNQSPMRVALVGPSAASLVERLGVLLSIESAAGIECGEVDLLAGVDDEYFNAIILEGSYRSIDQMKLLLAARSALKAEGTLIVFAEFLDDDREIRHSLLPNISSFKQLSTRLGFNLQAETNISLSARASIKTFNELARAYAASDRGCNKEMAEALPALIDELDEADHELSSGRRSLMLYSLRFAGFTNELTESEYARAEYGDKSSFQPADVAELFERSFGQPFDAAVWHWKYELGNGHCVVARAQKEGDLVAHYGGAPRKISYFGTSTLAIQPCDVMVMPEERTRYGRGSLFFKVAATFLEREIGNTVDHLLGFGFPNKKTMRLAIRLGLYEKTDDFIELRLPLHQPNAAAGMTESSITFEEFSEENAEHRECLEDLWSEMREGFEKGIVGERDWRYIEYRYLQHPHRTRYRLLYLRGLDGEIKALVVLKRSGEAWLLMDIVCAASRVAALLAELNIALAEESVRLGEQIGELLFWITKGWLELVELPNSTVHDLGIEIPCNSWNPGPSAELLYGKWWLTAGDMDFQ